MAEIFDIEDMRARKRMVVENEVAALPPHLLMMNFYKSVFDAGLKNFELAVAPMALYGQSQAPLSGHSPEKFSGPATQNDPEKPYFDIEDMRDRKRMIVENEVAELPPHLLMMNFCQSAFEASWHATFNASMKVFEHAVGSMIGHSTPNILLSADFLEQASGRHGLSDDLQTTGKKTYGRYVIADESERFNKDDHGHRAFSMTVNNSKSVISFFHGDLQEMNGERLEFNHDLQGGYKASFFVQRMRNGWLRDEEPVTQETVEKFLHGLSDAIKLQDSQKLLQTAHLHLVR